jgi:TatA/E family protein of Tat protein translocase
MNILGMGPMEVLLIVVLALIVFGPAKLPEIMGQIGKAINDFRKATSELSDEFNRTIQAEIQEGRSVFDETKAAVSDVHTTVNSAVTGTPAPVRTAAPEALPAANDAATELHQDTSAVSTNGTNGAIPAADKPPLADTTQWSWETAPAAAPAETATPEPSSAPDAPESEPSDKKPPKSSKSSEAAHDDLLPPY